MKASTISTEDTSRARSIAASFCAGAKKRSSEKAMMKHLAYFSEIASRTFYCTPMSIR
jgi:hypothetical protein